MKKHLLLSLCVLASLLSKAQVPEFYNTTTSVFTNNYPLNSGSFNKAQWIYPPNHFNSGGTGVGTPAYLGNIDKIYLKLGNSVAFNNYSNISISLSQNVGTNASFGTVPGTAYGFVTGMTQCFYQASGFNLAGATANSWIGIPLTTTSFAYNPALSLVVEIKVSGGGGNSISLASSATPRRLFGGYASASATNATDVANFGFNMKATPLPATMSFFTGKIEGDKDVLTWETNCEKNNSHFNLQHSTDGISFKTLAKVASKATNGDCETALGYEVINSAPANGVHNYYRLEQVDINGAIANDNKIVDLYRKTDGTNIQVTPNPAKDFTYVNILLSKDANIEIQLTDINGRNVRTEKVSAKQGNNNISVDLNNIIPGHYHLQVKENTKLIHTAHLLKE